MRNGSDATNASYKGMLLLKCSEQYINIPNYESFVSKDVTIIYNIESKWSISPTDTLQGITIQPLHMGSESCFIL